MGRMCPVCCGVELDPQMTMQGIEVDFCGECHGIWLEKGEVFHFTKKPGALSRMLEQGMESSVETSRKSPVSGKPMREMVMLGGRLAIDRGPDGGLWFDADELKELLAGVKDMKMGIEGVSATRPKKRRKHAGRARLLKLPNLALRSISVLTGLYAILVFALITLSLFTGMPPSSALLIGATILLVQFLISPFIMDLSLKWFYRMDWTPLSKLPEGTQEFIVEVCRKNRMKPPRMGIIDDGAPNAFTYGHTPGNARVIITAGLFDLLTEDELNAVIGHEIGHAKHWDILLMTVASLAPLILYYIFRVAMKVRAKKQAAAVKVAVVIVSYLLYIASEYIVLWFSRTREYYADRFSGEATGDPGMLAQALVKIGYGLAGREKKKAGKEKSSQRVPELEAIGAMGIFDGNAARALAVTSIRLGPARGAQAIDTELVKRAARWDLWNPWASFYELHSTHPLIAKRLKYLSNQAQAAGLEPYVDFDETKPESFWDEFLVDVIVHILPAINHCLHGRALLPFSGVGPFGRLSRECTAGNFGIGVVIGASDDCQNAFFLPGPGLSRVLGGRAARVGQGISGKAGALHRARPDHRQGRARADLVGGLCPEGRDRDHLPRLSPAASPLGGPVRPASGRSTHRARGYGGGLVPPLAHAPPRDQIHQNRQRNQILLRLPCQDRPWRLPHAWRNHRLAYVHGCMSSLDMGL